MSVEMKSASCLLPMACGLLLVADGLWPIACCLALVVDRRWLWRKTKGNPQRATRKGQPAKGNPQRATRKGQPAKGNPQRATSQSPLAFPRRHNPQ